MKQDDKEDDEDEEAADKEEEAPSKRPRLLTYVRCYNYEELIEEL